MKNYQAKKDKSGNWYVQKDGKTYCEMTWICGDPELNAALLAQKLNAHEALLEACQQAAQAIPTTHGAFETVRAAIAKATLPVS